MSSTWPSRVSLAAGLLLSLHTASHAQVGYAITVKGDTLKGRVDILTYDVIDRVEIKNITKTNLIATQVRTVAIDGELYLPVRYEQTYRMMKMQKRGYASILLMRPQSQNMYSTPYLLKLDGKGVEVPGLGFRKVVGDLLNDCGDVGARIKSGELGRGDLDKIVDEYNACIDARTLSKKDVKLDQQVVSRLDATKAFAAQLTAASFPGRKDALEMIQDIEGKIRNQQAVPNYVWSGLKEALKDQSDLLTGLDTLMKTLNP